MSSCFFPTHKLGELTNSVVIRCSLNYLHEFYSILSIQRRKIVDEYIFGNFFKCRQTDMSDYLVKHLIENSQVNGIFILKDNKFQRGLKDVALIIGMKVVKTDFKPILESRRSIVEVFVNNQWSVVTISLEICELSLHYC